MGGEVNCSDSRYRDRNSKRLRSLSRIRELIASNLPSYFDIKYEDIVLNALEVIERDVLLNKSIHWKMLLRVVRVMRANEETLPNCLKFVKEMFSLFERHKCKDISVIAEFLQVMHVLTTNNLKFVDYDQFMEIRKSFYMPYGAACDMDLVWKAVRDGNVGILKFQLKFGMTMMTPNITEDACNQYIKILLYYWWFITKKRDEIRIAERLRCFFNAKSKKRLCIVLRILIIVVSMKRYPECRERFTECYELLFDSIPEAYVTSVEVKASLQKCLPAKYSVLIYQMTEDFKRLLPELAEVPQPRSLQHLCRIRVRESLRQNLNLPHGVSSLPLPSILKKYIMLHDDGDYNIMKTTSICNDWQKNLVCLPIPIRIINIPEGDDCITSFLKNL